MVLKNSFKTLIAITLLLSGCGGCNKSKTAKSDVVEKAELSSHSSIEPVALFLHVPHFLYKSEITFSIKKGDSVKDTYESNEIQGVKPYMLLKRKTDTFHFFEVFFDEDNYLVKNQHGPFRKADNKKMFQELFTDSFNLSSWLIEQFALKPLYKGQNIAVSHAAISPDAPFIKTLRQNYKAFAAITASNLNCLIAFDKKTNLPISLQFDAHISGSDSHAIQIRGSMALDLVSSLAPLIPPEVHDEPVLVPVNSVPRFNELMMQEKKALNK